MSMELFSAFSSLSSWFTPSFVFLLLNLVIGTILLTARFGSSAAREHHDPPPPGLARAHSSSLLDRVETINLSLYEFDQFQPDPPVQDPARLTSAPSLPEPVTEPEPQPETEPKRAPNPKTMTKSASEKIARGVGEKEDEIAVEKRRPATARAAAETRRERAKTDWSLEECIDSKADEFIDRFRNQLRLQRLESLKRFSEMIKEK